MTASNDMNQPSCNYGEWLYGLCVCKQGYESSFDDVTLHPEYCSDRRIYLLSHSTDSTVILFHFMTMSVSVIHVFFKVHRLQVNVIFDSLPFL